MGKNGNYKKHEQFRFSSSYFVVYTYEKLHKIVENKMEKTWQADIQNVHTILNVMFDLFYLFLFVLCNSGYCDSI